MLKYASESTDFKKRGSEHLKLSLSQLRHFSCDKDKRLTFHILTDSVKMVCNYLPFIISKFPLFLIGTIIFMVTTVTVYFILSPQV